MSTLFAGPFVGEFGFELFEWQGYLREMAKDYDEVIISSRTKHEIIYKDFCTKFVPFDAELRKCAGWTNYDFKYKGGLHEIFRPTKIIYIDNEGDANETFKGVVPKFISYGEKILDFKVDIIIHARMVLSMNDSYKLSRNWSKVKWESLIKKIQANGLTIGSIGVSGFSEYIEGTKNFMDLDLEKLSNVLSSSKVIVGPSSGPMHFATLCKCPQFVWTSNVHGIGNQNRSNYEKFWNPFSTKTYIYDDGGWDPEVNFVYEKFMKFYENLENGL